MSGGTFDYIQYRIEDAATEIGRLIERDGDEYTHETLARFRATAVTLNRAAKMLQRVDWLVSADDGEDTFHERWEQEITP